MSHIPLTTDLSVAGADAYYLSTSLTYAWTTTSAPAGSPYVAFSVSQLNAAEDAALLVPPPSRW